MGDGDAGDSGGGGIEPQVEATPENFRSMMADPDFVGFGDDSEPANDNDKAVVAVADAAPDQDVEHDRGDPPGAVDEPEEAEGDELEEFDADDEGEEVSDDDELHGLKAKDVLAALKEGKLPPELLEHLQVPVKIRGEESLVSAKEAADGYQRLSDYSRARNEVREQEAELTRAKQAFDGLLDSWTAEDKVEQTVKQMRRLGLPVKKIATYIAEDHVSELQMTPTERDLRRRLRELEDKEEAAKEAAELDQHRGKQTQQTQAQKDAKATWDSSIEGALQAQGLKDTKRIREMAIDHLRNLWDGKSPLSERHVSDAVQATAEELAELAGTPRQAQPQGKPKPKAPALPVRRESGPAPKRPKGRSSRDVEPTLDNFRAHIAKLASRRG